MSTSFWAAQSNVTEPGAGTGAVASAIQKLPPDVASLRDASSQLVLHYKASENEVKPSRRGEINTLYAAEIFDVVLSRDASLSREREPDQRFVGCCRDAVVLFLAMARHHKIPARGRVGFAAYIRPGWMIDHVIAEVYDAADSRWRLVDPEMPASFNPTVDGHAVDWMDLRPGIDFQTGAEAWTAVRRGGADADKYLVTPEWQVPALVGEAYIAHNVLHDLAFMDKHELLLWDCWGLQLEYLDGSVPETHAALLDEVSKVLGSRDVEPDVVAELMRRDALRLPLAVTRYDPNDGPVTVSRQVDISRVLHGI